MRDAVPRFPGTLLGLTATPAAYGPNRFLCALLAACAAVVPACAGGGSGSARSAAGDSGGAPAGTSPVAAAPAARSPSEGAGQSDTALVMALPSTAGAASISSGSVPAMKATALPWSPPPVPEPPEPTVGYATVWNACDSAAAWARRAVDSTVTREDGPAYEGRRGCTLTAEFRTERPPGLDTLFVHSGWVYLRHHLADGPGSTVYAFQSRETFCQVYRTWPTEEESSGGAPVETLQVRCVPLSPLDDLETAIEHLGRSPDPVCLMLAREAIARSDAGYSRMRRRWARFEDGGDSAGFVRVDTAGVDLPRGPDVPGISYVTALSRSALAGQIALNEARALRRPDTATIVRRCTWLDALSGTP